MPLPGIKPVAGRGQPVVQATRSRVTLPGPGGFGAKTQPPIAKPGAGKGRAPSMLPPAQPPMFNLPSPVQAPPMAPPPASFFQPAPGPQTPIGGFQTPPPAQNPPVSVGNFGTIQPGPYPVSEIAMPTPNPVPPAPPPNLPVGGQMTPGSMGDQIAQQQQNSTPPNVVNPFSQVPIGDQYNTTLGGMNSLPGMGGPVLIGGPADPLHQNPLSMGGLGGPPQMTFQDYIAMGMDPATAQTMMGQFGPK